MKKSTVSIIIGSTIVFLWCIFFSWFSTRGGPKYPIDILAIGLGAIFFWTYFYIFIPLAIAGVVFGIIGLKKDTKRYLSWIGIIVNLLAIMLFISFFVKSSIEDAKYEKTKIQITLPKGSILTKGGPSAFSTVLSEKYEIQGIIFQKGTKLEFYDNKCLKSAYLPSSCEIGGIIWPAGSWVTFQLGSGHIGEKAQLGKTELLEDKEIQGIIFPKGSQVSFFNGFLDYVKLPAGREIEIQGIPCLEELTFQRPYTKVRAARLAKDYEIEDIAFPRRSLIEFWYSGKLRRAIFGSDIEINGKKYLKGQRIAFDEKTGNIVEDKSMDPWEIKAILN